mmetsp:Transcript_64467/g.188621  ORF Transcript_64467/g.188621 Transcript_64467/m.188621 type:complete len:212 (+) Transcript_64467:2454-3089(+)
MLPLKLVGNVAIIHFNKREILFQQDCMVHHCVFTVEVIEHIRVKDTHAAAVEDPLFVELLHVPVAHRLSRGNIHPAAVVHRGPACSWPRPVEVLDESQHPSQEHAAFNAELTVALHLPARPGITPRTHFTKASDDNGGCWVHHAPQPRQCCPLLLRRRCSTTPCGVQGIGPGAHQVVLHSLLPASHSTPTLDEAIGLPVALDKLDLGRLGV